MKIINMKIITIALIAVLCISTANVTAAGQTGAEKAIEVTDDWSAPDPASVRLINSKRWEASDISTVEAIYGTDCITVSPSPTQEIILKEYLSEDSDSYDAKTTVSDSTLKIEMGDRPQFSHTGYISRIELYLPSSFRGSVILTTKTGAISLNGISASKVTVRSQNGPVTVSNISGTLDCETDTGGITINGISASKVTVRSQNGHVTASNISGTLDCKTSTGGISVNRGHVTGDIHSQNGSIDISLHELQGILNISTETGMINAALPDTSAFTISASTDTGNITNEFTENWGVSRGSVTGATLAGTWGEQPNSQISLITSNGSIKLYLCSDSRQ